MPSFAIFTTYIRQIFTNESIIGCLFNVSYFRPILKTVAFAGNDRIAIMWTNRVQTTLRVDLCDENANTCTTVSYIFTFNIEERK